MQHILWFMLWKYHSGGLQKSHLTSLCTLNWDIQNKSVVPWESWSLEETQGQVLCNSDGAPSKMNMSQSMPVGLRAWGQSLALSVFSSIDIAGDWTQRLSLQKCVTWSYNKFIELQQNRWMHWPHSSDQNHCFMARKLPISTLNLFVVSLYILVCASIVLSASLIHCN